MHEGRPRLPIFTCSTQICCAAIPHSRHSVIFVDAGGSRPPGEAIADDGEWWIGNAKFVGQTADVMLGPPSCGVLRVRDSARIPAKIFRTWRVFAP